MVELNWQAIIGVSLILGSLIVWFMRLEARLNSKLSIDKHQDICDRLNIKTIADLNSIKELIVEANVDRSKMKHEINNELHEINIKLAVLISQSK